MALLVAATGDALAQEPPQPSPEVPGYPLPVAPTAPDDDEDDEGAPESVAPQEPVAHPMSGAIRTGIYADGDQTYVFRVLGAIAAAFNRWTVSGSVSADVVSSASVDVRSSPGLSKVDVVSSASGTTSTSGGTMTDRRFQVTGGLGWKDDDGHAVNFSASFANERDYNSVGGGFNGSIDVFHRMTTLLGGIRFTGNFIGSVLDPTFSQRMVDLGWSAGVAQVLSRKDALRLRYDGGYSDGYQASPYRNVRFGDWRFTVGDYQHIIFSNTIGSADGLPETVPATRLQHALVLEWLHSLLPGLGLHTEARLGIDSWGMKSATGALDLRTASGQWRVEVGYRFYIQSSADFYQSKYTLAPSNYSYFTSDKELGRETGHVAHLDVSRVLLPSRRPGGASLLFDGRLTGMYYTYPDFVLLGSRAGIFLDLGFTWEN